MKKAITILVLIFSFTSCKKTEKTNKIASMDWLVGKWENNSDQGNLSETWEKADSNSYKGQSYFIKAKDTLHFESIHLKSTGENVLYTSTIKGQNNDKAVEYKLTNATAKQLVFENLKQDYPKKIVYRQITQDSIMATISGVQQGKASTESYPLKRAK